LEVEGGATRQTYWDFIYMRVPGTGSSHPYGMLVICSDVTERVESERRNQAQIAALEQADRLKDELLGVVSHELRTPVHIVLGYLRLFLMDRAEPLAARQWAHLEKASRKAEELASIVNAVLDFSQLRAGTLVLAPEQVDVGAFVEDLTGPLADLAKERGLTLTTATPDDPLPARLDPLRMGQVLTNLVGNAIKFTAAGGTIHVAVERRDERLRLEVTDNGIGIDPAHQARIFERFVQADMALTREAGGVGLGLAIARELVEAHGGTIGVESAPGQGSTFWIELPLAGPAPIDTI
jgi:signal transduction histidine kinase